MEYSQETVVKPSTKIGMGGDATAGTAQEWGRASSIIRIFDRRRRALAKHSSCLWPTLKDSPPSATCSGVQGARGNRNAQ